MTEFEYDKRERQEEAEEAIKKYDKESGFREFSGWKKQSMATWLVIFACFQLYTAAFGILPIMLQRSAHLGFVMVAVFLLYPANSGKNNPRLNIFLDIIPCVLSLVVNGYIFLFFDDIANRGAMPTPAEYYLGIIAILLVLEAGRRVMGNILVTLSIFFLIYCLFGEYFPGMFIHKNVSIGRMIQHFYLTPEGIYGIALGVSSTFVVLFIIFGAFLAKSGAGEFFTDFGLALAGRSSGGPAKVAIFSSAFLGTINGSSIANVATTGTFTIPLMKKLGYSPEYAAGVEATASTGGQIMPPIMGAAAFIMAELLNVSYLTIVKAAIVPASLYFFALFVGVHLEAKKRGLKGMSKEQLPILKNVLMKRGHLVLPIIVITVLLINGFTPLYAAFYGIIATIFISYFRKETRLTPKRIIFSLESGARTALSVAIACALVGFIIGTTSLTGLGLVVANNLVNLAHGNTTLTLLLAMFTCLVLGMGLPTTANYIVTATLIAPALFKLGIPLLVAHFFCFQYGITADITPPVCLASYTGAGIAKADKMKTGLIGAQIGIGAFIIPFLFVYSPMLLLIDAEFWPFVIRLTTCVIGLIAFIAGLAGYLIVRSPIYERMLLFISALALLFTTYDTVHYLGLAMFLIILSFQWYRKSREDKRRV